MKVGVIGAGVVGLSATATLIKLGADVTCYEKFGPMSERSTGASRIFRLAHTTPKLVKLAQVARDGFLGWAEESGRPLINPSGCVITGSDLHAWAAAMRESGAHFDIVDPDDDRVQLPSRLLPSELLIDHSGGVIDAQAVATYLVRLTKAVVSTEPVYALENHDHWVRIRTPGSFADVDAVLIAAGSGTCALAAQVGIYTPSALAHHVRFTFPMRRIEPFQAWIDKPSSGLSTYQHSSERGKWVVGGHIELEKTIWEVGPEAAIAASRELVLHHVRDKLDAIQPTITDHLYCTITPGYGDGFRVQRNGAALAIYGENLFKLAPALGELMARAALDTPTEPTNATVYAF